MEDQHEIVPPMPFQRGEVLTKLNRISSLEKFKVLHRSVCWMIENITEKVGFQNPPRNPRQDILQRCDKNNLRVLQQRKIRLEEKMELLEESIKKDIESENKL